MSKELVIGSNRHETKVAILEDDQLVEVYFQRANEYSLAGSVHKGRVTRVLPGMQSAFVDLGLERDTFLYVTDFFEENEDIDTVVEDKPNRGERRDRLPNNRLVERPAAKVLELTAEPAPAMAVEPGDVPDAVVVLERAPGEERATLATGPEQRPQDRGDGDRNLRGDRRGRRSRRRKPRPGGIPDTKYAQPGDSEPERVAAGPFEDAAESIEEPRDVIILPGESLAKYRRPVVAQGVVPLREHPVSPIELSPRDEVRAPEPDTEDDNQETADSADLSEQAEELELTDKIFSHHEPESVPDEEEKLAEVRQDQPVSPFVVNDIEVEDEPAREAPVEAVPEESSIEMRQAPLSERLFWEPKPSEPPEVAEEKTEPPFAEEGSESEGLSAGAGAEDKVPEGGPLDLDEFEAADLEDVEAIEIPEAPAVQTASVREQSGQSPHRVSRRMRRRRGGNRFGQQGQQAGSDAPA